MAEDPITLEIEGKIAIITLNLPQKLNALTQDLYYRLGGLMREVAKREDIYITMLIGKGRYFSAGADVTATREEPERDVHKLEEMRQNLMRSFVSNNLDLTRTFYTHPKILVTALNGPVIGLTAAIVSFSDFIYAAPRAFLLTPFTSLGLVAEGGASRAFVQRLGISRANEALIMSKRITSDELLNCGFVNKIIDTENDTERFREKVLKEIKDRLGDHLNGESLLKVKELIRRPEREILDKQNVDEVFGGLERFLSGIPQEEFRKIAKGEKRHKL